ncbi:hypothetical protein [Nocardia sp. NPDC005998]|uniref:GH36-type glycosyl hydrolase domain-containing protein n=1 Tax=Nocardia sp. NPDC005998 TaxID=3156894 RepID=UPI0033B68808
MGFGHWGVVESLPAFEYTVDQDRYAPARWDPVLAPSTTRHWTHVGNRRITLVADNEGLCGLWDAFEGYLWITEPQPSGTGVSRVVVADDVVVSTSYHERGARPAPRRWTGPVFSRVSAEDSGVHLERTVLCPAGEVPWVLVRVVVGNTLPRRQRLTVIEEWLVRPATVDVRTPGRSPVKLDPATASPTDQGVRVGPLPVGVPCSGSFIALDRLGSGPVRVEHPGAAGVPRLALAVDVELAAGAEQTLFFRFGLADGEPVSEPADLYARSLQAVGDQMPEASAADRTEVAREIAWHAALLAGGVCADGVLGGHTLDQGSVYAFGVGVNAAARDPLQHALPLVYVQPDLALSVLRNTCSWGSPNGDLPYALDGRKRPWTDLFRPSDQNLWALWLAAEYAAATGDLACFDESLGYHPEHNAEPVPLGEHLRRQFDYFAHEVGRGPRGHIRILNADWNDGALDESSVDREVMAEQGESVLNSAMAAWVLPVYASLADRLGQGSTASAARALAEQLRAAVAQEWNGRWFRRAHAPGAEPIGEHDLWLEVQPWAILCGAASAEQTEQLLATIDATREGSPLGARIRWPALPQGSADDLFMRGSIWYSVNMTLVWAAARHAPELAWDEWHRMTLSAHTAAYPDIWEGTLSGPDSYLVPELPRAGRTWVARSLGVAMQAYPIANMHCHSQPLLAYLRLLGVEPTSSGALNIGGGAYFSSRVLTVRPDGSGQLATRGEVTVHKAGGGTITGAGTVRW